jgi:nicotinamidase-related amidase
LSPAGSLADLLGRGGSGSSTAAVLTMEVQRGVVGDLSSFPELARSVAQGHVIENAARLCAAARVNGAPVVHCTAGFRADRRGSPTNAPLIASMLRRPDHLLEGSASQELVPELGATDSDVLSYRRHGVSPFSGTDLDPILRSLGISTVVAAGVSLNIGIVGLTIEAVNLGYRVVVATDAVAGTPPEYGPEVLKHCLGYLARLATVDEIVAALATNETAPSARPTLSG